MSTCVEWTKARDKDGYPLGSYNHDKAPATQTP